MVSGFDSIQFRMKRIGERAGANMRENRFNGQDFQIHQWRKKDLYERLGGKHMSSWEEVYINRGRKDGEYN